MTFFIPLMIAFATVTANTEEAFYSGASYAKPSLDYAALDALLQANPLAELPLTSGGERPGKERREAAKALNAHIFWEGPRSQALADFYRNRIRRAFQEIKTTPAPNEGVLIWKLYSSGVVVKSKEGVFAFDVVEGPVPPGVLPPEAWSKEQAEKEFSYLYPFPLSWDAAMRHDYAALVDVHFATHFHYDHLEGALVAVLLEAGKSVVMPEQARQMCIKGGIAGADAIITMPQHQAKYLRSREHEVAGIKVITFKGYQDEYNVEEEEERLIWRLNTTDPAVNYVYIARIGGVNIFHNGDVHNCPTFYPWLVNLVDTKWAPNLCLTVPWFANWKSALGKLFPQARLCVIHELELGHTKFSEERPPFRFGLANARYLMWGEKVYVAAP